MSFSSAADPGHKATSSRSLNGVITVFMWWCRSSGSGSTYNNPVTISPAAAPELWHEAFVSACWQPVKVNVALAVFVPVYWPGPLAPAPLEAQAPVTEAS